MATTSMEGMRWRRSAAIDKETASVTTLLCCPLGVYDALACFYFWFPSLLLLSDKAPRENSNALLYRGVCCGDCMGRKQEIDENRSRDFLP